MPHTLKPILKHRYLMFENLNFCGLQTLQQFSGLFSFCLLWNDSCRTIATLRLDAISCTIPCTEESHTAFLTHRILTYFSLISLLQGKHFNLLTSWHSRFEPFILAYQHRYHIDTQPCICSILSKKLRAMCDCYGSRCFFV